MNEAYNKDKNGNPLDQYVIQQVWEKGKIIEGNSPAIWRKDNYGHFMKRELYGERSARYGWVIDHIKPLSAGGDDNLENLEPVQFLSRQRSD